MIFGLFKTKKEPDTVTRFINSENFINRDRTRVTVALFDTSSNRANNEISVYDIDDKIKSSDEEKIYRFSKLKKEPFARADLNVKNIKEINDPVQLFVEKTKKTLKDKHWNIKPFPSDKRTAKVVASKLVLISKLHLRK